MAWWQKTGFLGDVGNRQPRISRKQTFRIFYTKSDNPIAERHVIRSFDVPGQVGTVGMKHIWKLLYGKAGPDITVRIDTTFDFFRYFGMEKRSILPLCLFPVCGVTQVFLFRSHAIFHRVFHLFVKQQIVQIAKEEINVKRYRWQNPDIDVFIRQECQQSASHPECDSPVGENGKPFDIGTDVVRTGVIENADDPVIGPEKPTGQEQPIDNQPCGQGKHHRCL